jgi:chemosensory pili system protein ChpC
MSQLAMQEKKQQKQVDSLFVQLVDHTLLLPMSSVAEVVQHVTCEPEANTAAWLHGWMEWRHQRVPLILFEGLAEGDRQRDPEVSLALVMNTLNSAAGFPFYAILIQDFPQLVRISGDDQLQEVAGTPGVPYAIMRVGLDEREALIPDLEGLEKYLSANL